MNYDELVNLYLTEAYFSNPFEKANGIKKQVAIATEADRETQDRKKEKIMAAAEITAEIMNEIYQNIGDDPHSPEPSRDDFIRIAFAALGTAGFDDQALQRAFDDPDMKAVADEFTLADFRKYHQALELVFKDTPYKFLTPERIRRILKDLEAHVAELIKQKELQDAQPEEPEEIPQRSNGMPAPTDYAMQLMRKAGKAV